MTKLVLQDVANLQNESTVVTALKSNNSSTSAAMEITLSRDGTAPNQMISNFDMNNYKIINLPDALTAQEPATYSQLTSGLSAVGNGAVVNADYVTLSNNPTLLSERVLTQGIYTSKLDTGPGGTVTIDVSDPELIALANTTSATDTVPYYTGSGTASTTSLPAYGRTLIGSVDAPTARSNLGSVIGTNVEAWDADLDAVAGLSTTGLITRTGAGTANTRTITGTANEITSTNGDGVAGNPIVSLPSALTFTGKTVTNGTFNSPTLVTPALGTPASGVATNLTGTAAGLTAGNVTTNANLTGPITSVGNTTSIASQTGTGTKFVVDTSPTLVTPTIGAATATTVNKVTITPPATSAILTIPNGVTLTGPASSGTAMTLGNAETVTGVKTFGAAGNVGQLVVAGTTSGSTVVNATAAASGTLTLPAATDTLVGKATTDTLTNKTFDTAGTGNSFKINGTAVTAVTGTGSNVLATSPTLVTPSLGVPTALTLTNATGLPLSGLNTEAAFTFVGNNTSGAASPTAVDIAGLTVKGSPASTDLVMISDQAASGAWKKATVSSLASAGSVASIDTLTGTFTTANGVTSSGNVIGLTAARRTLPTTQVFTSGSALTYTTPANCLWIAVHISGGGGGGGGSGTSGMGAGGIGGTTTFNSITAIGGSGGAAATTATQGNGGGAGGTGGTGTTVYRIPGAQGGNGCIGVATVTNGPPGIGGTGHISHGGAGGPAAGNGVGGAGGGGGGEYAYIIQTTPAATYTYTVGAAGTSGATGTGGGAGIAGQAGKIVVIEYYGT